MLLDTQLVALLALRQRFHIERAAEIKADHRGAVYDPGRIEEVIAKGSCRGGKIERAISSGHRRTGLARLAHRTFDCAGAEFRCKAFEPPKLPSTRSKWAVRRKIDKPIAKARDRPE